MIRTVAEFLHQLMDAEVARLDSVDIGTVLLVTGLVAMADDEMELITDRCRTAVLPDGRLIAGEDNTGRLTRWIARYLDDR
jgi:hypothetical protein